MTIVSSGAAFASPEDRFRGLFARHYGAVFAYCARRLGRDEAQDAAADVFTVAWRRIRRVPGEEEILPWLYGVSRRVVANRRRSASRRARLIEKAAEGWAQQTSEPAVDLDHVLARLREDDREILMLSAWEGLGPEELGSALGCSPNAATVRLHRARARLTAAWDKVQGGVL